MEIFSFTNYTLPAIKLSQKMTAQLKIIKTHRFPDGETSIRLPKALPSHMVIIQSMDQANEKLIELLLSCKTARENGVQRITLITPYLCYMRQDIAFHKNESISQQIIGKFIAELVDDVITVDPHLHRIEHLQQAIPCNNAISISAMQSIAQYVEPLKYDTVIGPDSESKQWVEQLASIIKTDYLVASKKRYSDQKVEVLLPNQSVKNKKVLITDDMISTGHTIAECAKQLRQRGAKIIDCVCTHALFNESAEMMMHGAGINNIISSDSLPHHSNRINLASTLHMALDALR